MDIVAYCRVSTDKSDQLNSLETQKRFFEEYAERTGKHLLQIYADEGISGTKIKNRLEFQRLLEDARRGLFCELIVKDVSRMARNTVDFLQSIRALKALNIETVFITSDMKVLGNSEFVLTLMGAMAQEESSNTSKRVKFGKRENAKKGRVPNFVYGYDKVNGDYFHLYINQEEARVVQMIFDWYTIEGFGALQIANMLNARYVRTKRGALWTQNAVSRILKNELYIGKVINGKEEVTDFLTGTRKVNTIDQWMISDKEDIKIIEPKQFERAQQIRIGRQKSMSFQKVRESNKHMFSSLIYCKECGHAFRRIVRSYHNTYYFWVCNGRNLNGVNFCNNRTRVDEQELLIAIKNYCIKFLPDVNIVMDEILDNKNWFLMKESDSSFQEKETRKLLPYLYRKKEKLMALFLDDIISHEELKQRMALLQEEITAVETEITKHSALLSSNEEIRNKFMAVYIDLNAYFYHGDFSNAIMKKLIEKICIDSDVIHIYINKI